MYTTMLLARSQRTVYLDLALYNYVLEREGSIMGEGLGSRILRIRSRRMKKGSILRSIGREDLADVHPVFFYKGLPPVLYCLGKIQKDLKEKYRGFIQERLLTDRGKWTGYMHAGRLTRRKRKRWKFFLKSPKLYLAVIMVNERFLIPVKQWLPPALKTENVQAFKVCDKMVQMGSKYSMVIAIIRRAGQSDV